jgi:outer membrane protein assembly factor BamB
MEKKIKMKIFSKKNFFSTIAIILMLTFVTSMFALPNASAQTSAAATYPFVDAIPKIAGVGQPVLINWGLLNYLSDYADGWNVTLQIIYPNGDVKNHTGKTWSTGTVGRKMSFMEEGNYTLICIFDGERYNNRNYASSKTENFTLQIRADYWKPDHPGHNLPDEYWTRPVDAQLREWWSIMGSWVATPQNFYAPWNDAPESAHILWNMPIGDTMGGLSGGDTGDVGFQNGDAYEGKFANSVIIAGVLYYNKYFTGLMSSNSPQQAIVAVDLHTGKVLWERSYNFGAGRISRGQIFNFITENNRGSWAYIWLSASVTGQGTVMYALDALTGDLKFNMTNVPGGTIYVGPNGEMLKYSVTAYNGVNHLLRWNSTYVVNRLATSGTSDAWGSQIQGRTFDASRGYDVNTSTGITGSIGSLLVAFPGDRAIFGNTSAAGVTLTGISLDTENVGAPIFTRRTWTAPKEWADLTMTTQTRWAAFSNNPYVAVFWTKENRVNYAFSLENGRPLWQSESHGYADAWTNAGLQGAIVNGKLYEASISGVVYCYDAATGDVLWTYEAQDKHNESYHGENWWITPLFISDGKIYLGHMVHSPDRKSVV